MCRVHALHTSIFPMTSGRGSEMIHSLYRTNVLESSKMESTAYQDVHTFRFYSVWDIDSKLDRLSKTARFMAHTGDGEGNPAGVT